MLFFVFLALANAAIDCNACSYNCRWFDALCHAKQSTCKAAADAFDLVVSPIIAGCANYNGRMDNRNQIEDAMQIIIRTGLMVRSDFENVDIRWCAHLGGWADGMAPRNNLVLLHPRYKAACPGNRSRAFAHSSAPKMGFRWLSVLL